MIERIIASPKMTTFLQYTASSHVVALGIKLIFVSALPFWLLHAVSIYRQASMLALITVLVLTGVSQIIQQRYSYPKNLGFTDSATIAITILLTSLIFLDGQIEEESIMYFTQELPMTTWHLKIIIDCIFGILLGKEIYKIFQYSHYSLESTYAQQKIKQHACKFLVELLAMLAVFLASTHAFNIDKLSRHLAKYILHIFDIAFVCATISIIVVWISYSNPLLKKIFTQENK